MQVPSQNMGHSSQGVERQTSQPTRPAKADKSLVFAHGTVAGKPGQLKFSASRFLKCYPHVLGIAVATLIIFPLGALVSGKSLIAGAGVGIVGMIYVIAATVEKKKKKFHGGNLCAAVVVGSNPYKVAVLTDLCNDRSGPVLAIGIRPQPLQKMFGGPPKTGDRLAAISTYFGPPGNGAWRDFMPTIINIGCEEPEQIQSAMASIDANDWSVIEQALPKMASKNVGLYHLSEIS